MTTWLRRSDILPWRKMYAADISSTRARWSCCRFSTRAGGTLGSNRPEILIGSGMKEIVHGDMRKPLLGVRHHAQHRRQERIAFGRHHPRRMISLRLEEPERRFQDHS